MLTHIILPSRFSTSRQTLNQLPDTFFSALLSGRISTLRDDKGAIFIDRDPQLFAIILNYLRTREIDINKCSVSVLLHEAEFYNIAPLVKRLMLCQDLSNSSSCGDILFYGYLTPPNVPVQDSSLLTSSAPGPSMAPPPVRPQPQEEARPAPDEDTLSQRSMGASGGVLSGIARPGQMVRVPENAAGHSRNSSWDMRVGPARPWGTHSRTASLDMRHSRNSSADLNKFIRNDLAQVLNQTAVLPTWHDPLRVQMIKAHSNWICVAYAHFVTCYRLKDSVGWQVSGGDERRVCFWVV